MNKFQKLVSFTAAAIFIATAPSAESYKVGSTATGVPFTFLDAKSGQIEGMMVDLIHAVGEEAGFEADVNAVDFSSLIPSLNSDRIDLISAAMLITPAREAVISFSDPVMPYGEGLIVNKDFTGTIGSGFSGLEGKVIGVQQGTVYLENLQKIDGIGEVRAYDSLADILSEVNRGRIDVGVGDKPIVSYQMSQGTYQNIKFVEGYESQFEGSIAIGVRKDDTELLERVNAALQVLKDNGTVGEIAVKWGLQ
ncbi:ABC transporter substrate-binding protein [Pseudophaeobacter flagellatus]|uniref:ABC transporter substrate-binding protein n=1 Tax=Pseudophaeobacter flagellatus TaxID=2899119 RepID=UPI001E5CA85A|nr:ABC transporter substrate-binding protein [Pseudophaeobacter flagellatus]MCD9150079.1 ABC transporter substrate-binding protein [Pseudophaeobacter flagellatus]